MKARLKLVVVAHIALVLAGCAFSTNEVLRRRADHPWVRLFYDDENYIRGAISSRSFKPSPLTWENVPKKSVGFIPLTPPRPSQAGEQQTISVPYYDSREHGGVDGETILFLHGTPGGHEVWAPVVFQGGLTRNNQGKLVLQQGLARSNRIVMLDLPGHGLASAPARPVSLETQADFVARFMEVCRIPKAIVVGHSYCGEVAWRLASGPHSNKVSKLVLVDALGFKRLQSEVGGSNKATLGWRAGLASTFGWRVPKGEVLAGLKEAYYSNNWEMLTKNRVVEMYQGYLSHRDNFRVNRTLTRQEIKRNDEAHVKVRLAQVTVPTLLIWGQHDPGSTTNTQARQFYQHITHSALVIIGQAAHNVHEERPKETAAAITKWLMGELPERTILNCE